MSFLLAAICFVSDQDVDAVFEKFAAALSFEGNKVCGVLQTRGLSQGKCHCSDMDLTTIGSQKTFRISQPLGQGSLGCRLNPGALAECSTFLQNEISEGCDLLILNRYGKGESEGRGFRDLISSSLSRNIPVLLAMRSEYQSSFIEFAGDIGTVFPMDQLAIEHWFANLEHKAAPRNVPQKIA